MTIAQHLDELRRRLLRASFALLITFGLAWFFIDPIMEFLLQPHYEAVASLQAEMNRRHELDPSKPLEVIDPRPMVTSYTEGIGIYLKVCLIAALLVSGPYILWEIWGFIAAGLYLKERKTMRRYFPLALLLFFLGIAFGYKIMIPIGLEFLIVFGSDLFRTQIALSEYFSLFLTLTFALGLIFQLPVVMTILARLGVVTPQGYRSKWRYVIVGCFIVSAIATPTPDPINQTLLAGSMYLLYELGILLSIFAYRERQQKLESLNS